MSEGRLNPTRRENANAMPQLAYSSQNASPIDGAAKMLHMRAYVASADRNVLGVIEYAVYSTVVYLYHNSKTGRCDPSIQGIADSSFVSANAARRAIQKLEREGWLAVYRSRGRSRNHYVPTLPPREGQHSPRGSLTQKGTQKLVPPNGKDLDWGTRAGVAL